MAQAQWKTQTEIGPLYLVASEKGLQGLFTKKQVGIPVLSTLKGKASECRHLAQATKELDEYFQGKRQKFSVALDFKGTDFQKKVWRELQKIPYGKTVSYRQIAEKLGVRAYRAVGNANGKNPLCIIVPCHRVIASNGGIGGYSGGLSMKKKLLALEGLSHF